MTEKEPDPPNVAAVKESLKQHLLAILEGPISVRMLTAVENTARISRDLLISMKDPRQPSRHNYVGNGIIMSGGAYGAPVYPDEVGEDVGAVGAMMPQSPIGMRAETFAATLMRELVAMGNKWQQPVAPVETASDLVMSVSRAKAESLPDDIIQGLEAKLRERLATEKSDHTISKALPAPIPPPTEGEHQHEHG